MCAVELPPRPRFESFEAYGRVFRSTEFWAPYVRCALARHGLPAGADLIPPTDDATNATFFAGEVVVKLFTPLTNGRRQRGLEAMALKALFGRLAVPRLIAQGELYAGDGWPWPYVVIERVPGVSLDSVWDRLSAQERRSVAVEMGSALRQLHDAPVAPQLRAAFDSRWEGRGFRAFLGRQRRHGLRQQEGHLPPAFLAAAEELVDLALANQPGACTLLHGDLTPDNVLVRANGGPPSLAAIIDFGDLKIGDPLYDLPALHAGWGGDTRLLAVCLEAYGWSDWAFFAERAMAYSLLHEWDVLPWTLKQRPDLLHCKSLRQMAGKLWEPRA